MYTHRRWVGPETELCQILDDYAQEGFELVNFRVTGLDNVSTGLVEEKISPEAGSRYRSAYELFCIFRRPIATKGKQQSIAGDSKLKWIPFGASWEKFVEHRLNQPGTIVSIFDEDHGMLNYLIGHINSARGYRDRGLQFALQVEVVQYLVLITSEEIRNI